MRRFYPLIGGEVGVAVRRSVKGCCSYWVHLAGNQMN